jgi:hypothetical protein
MNSVGWKNGRLSRKFSVSDYRAFLIAVLTSDLLQDILVGSRKTLDLLSATCVRLH